MQFELGEKLEGFRREIRQWILDHSPSGLADLADWNAPVLGGTAGKGLEEAKASGCYRKWESSLMAARLICPQWPEAVGGRGLSSVEMAVVNEEFHRAGVPRVTRGMGELLVGPSVIVHGSDEQRARFLPRIITGEDLYCQGFSEPDHGSDLAGIETRAVIDGEELVITGQKVWTSGANGANMMFLLCRTDPEAPRHHGITYVIVPMFDNNIEIRPIRQMSGPAQFCQEFISGARAPLSNVIGGINNGWRVAMTTLGDERASRATVQHMAYEHEFWELVELLRKNGKSTDPVTRQHLAWAYTEIALMRFSGARMLAELAQERRPEVALLLSKLQWSEYHKRFGELAMDLLGLDSLVLPDGSEYGLNRWQAVFLWSRAATIYSGTSEIQRNIIGERALGLPREPAPGASPTHRGGRGGAQSRQGNGANRRDMDSN